MYAQIKHTQPLYKNSMISKILADLWIAALAVWVNKVIPFLEPIQPYLIFMILAIICDTITGIMAARKQKITITSRGIWRTIEKIVIAGVAICISEAFRVVFLPDIALTAGVALVIAIAEMKSIFENYKAITGVDLLSHFMEKISKLNSSNVEVTNFDEHNKKENTDETK